MDYHIDELISEEKINERIGEIAKQLDEEYAGKELHLVVILKGSVFFACELAKRITIPVTMDFMAVASYGNGMVSAGEITVRKELDEDIYDKEVLIVEDILDSGVKPEYTFVVGSPMAEVLNECIDKIKLLVDRQEIENRKKHVLIVDDDVTFLKMAYSWLKDKYKVSIVNSAVQAITWLAKNKADVVLLDYEMPVVDGPALLEMLKSETDTDGIPIFFLTGKSDLKSVQKVMDMKPQGYLLKASGKHSLLQELDKFFIAQKTMK